MGWRQLLDIYAEATDVVRDELSQPPEACPHDGTPLEAGPHGELFCIFDGYQWPRDGRLI